ncbi:MAG: diguanylate cyclase [Candidatus Saccharibacteria bacterium]|nr:diguanylate cyclase [Pseudorhodobacter sp.]
MKSNDPDVEYWRAVIDAADLGVWDYDLETGEKTYSDKWREIRGLKEDEVTQLSDEDWLNTLHPDDVATARRFTTMINEGTANKISYEYRERNASGGYTWYMCRGRGVQFDQAGRATRFVGIDTDVSTMKMLEADRLAAAQQLEIALTIAEIGVWKYNIGDETAVWDRRVRKIYGLPEVSSPLPLDFWDRSLHPDDSARVLAASKIGQDLKQPYDLDYRIVRQNGEVRYVRSRVTFTDEGPDGPCFIGADWDVTDDVKKADDLSTATKIAQDRLAQLLVSQRELEYLNGHDSLTGINNRRAFEAHAAKLAPDGVASKGLGVMVIDVDNLKVINDSWGHAFGDAVLKDVANVIRAELGSVGIVARTGGDEFVALVSKSPSPQALGEMAETIVAKVRLLLSDGVPPRSISVGVSNSFEQARTVQDLIRLADRALYQSKNAGRSRVSFA